jgi:putative membrane protein
VAPGFRAASAAVFVLLGLLAAVQAWLGWVRTERALRQRRSLPGPSVGVVVVAGVAVGALILVAGVFA